MKLAQWLKETRITARELASRVDTTEATISRLKNARALPSLELAQRIAHATRGAVMANDFLIPDPSLEEADASLEQNAILLIIAGGIAAYKSLDLIRRLRERGARLHVILTRAGAQFVTPLSVGALAGEAPFTELFDQHSEMDVGHIRLAREADAIVVAPATADLMAKMASGLADDLATAVLLAADAPILLAPAMNPQMWKNPSTRRNVALLTEDGVSFTGPNTGEMAEAGEAGMGRMAEVNEIIASLEKMRKQGGADALAPSAGKTAPTGNAGLKGRHVVVTSGPTHEPIDPVRYIANRSSGKQGHGIAAAAARAGARVTLVCGPVQISDPAGVTGLTVVHVETAREMLAAVEAALPADIGIFAAAVADWRMPEVRNEKIKKTGPAQEMRLDLVQNPDILKLVSRGHKRPELVIGFAAETGNVAVLAKQKRKGKGCDWIVANDVSHETGIMGGDSNTVHLVTGEDAEDWPQMSKDEVAARLISRVALHFEQKQESVVP